MAAPEGGLFASINRRKLEQGTVADEMKPKKNEREDPDVMKVINAQNTA